MTKKSQARLLRDQQQKNNALMAEDVEKFNGRIKEVAGKDGWEALSNTYRNIVSVCHAHLPFAEVIRDTKLMSYVEDHVGLLKKIKQLMTDLTRITNAATQKYHEHKDFTGNWDDNFVEGLQVMDFYNGLLFEYESLVAPIAAQITEEIVKAEIKMNQAAEEASDKASAADTNVETVSTVEFVETQKG